MQLSQKKYNAEQLKFLATLARIELSRRSFWEYCNLMHLKFYKPERVHLVILCQTLDDFYHGRLLKKDGTPYTKLMINLPPRHGKSFTAVNFDQWVLGDNPENRIFTVSYNETLSGRFGKAVRNGMQEEKGQEDKIIYSDIFPESKVKQGDSSYQLWSLEGQFFNFLATSPGATMTGVGCNIGIIDDLIKNKEEAYNDNVLENHWDFYSNTFLSRLEEGALQIVIMTRWSTKDLCGRLLELEGDEWYQLSMKAFDEATQKMLCPELLSYESFQDKKKKISQEIVNANYQQNPINIQGRLYKSFKTYTDLPKDPQTGQLLLEEIRNYTDTADEGDDYLCSIDYGVYKGEAYVLDVLYTKDGMEVTEPETAKMMAKDQVNTADIESNNGGRGFARNVERILWDTHKTRRTVIRWFHQSKNKKARILSNSTFVMEHVYFPVNWKDRWPEYYKSMNTYQKEGKNEHDDAEDATTGIAEQMSTPQDVTAVQRI